MKISSLLFVLATMSYSILVNATDYTPKEDRKVAAFVLEASGKAYSTTDNLTQLKGELENRMKKSEASITFRLLQACRTTKKYRHNPKDIVAAEHYAYMRSQAAESGDSELKGMPTLYYDSKVKLKSEGKLQWLRTTDQVVSEPSEGARDWGELGVVHGLSDYEAESGKKPTPGKIAKQMKSDLALASSHQIFSWLNRKIVGNPYSALKNKDCHVKEPNI